MSFFARLEPNAPLPPQDPPLKAQIAPAVNPDRPGGEHDDIAGIHERPGEVGDDFLGADGGGYLAP